MAKIRKMELVARESSARSKRSVKREQGRGVETWATESEAAKFTNRMRRPDRAEKYARDMALVDLVGKTYRGEVRFTPLGNKKLKIKREGELVRERGFFTKKRKFLKRDADGKTYVERFEKESRRTKTGSRLDSQGKLIAKNTIRKDGSFEENWELDENHKLIRTKYFTSRFHDVGFGGPISEKIEKPFSRNGKTYRNLVREKGARKKVFELDDRGRLKPISRTTPNFSKHVKISQDGKTSATQIKHRRGFTKSYQSRLDVDGNEIGRDITSIRRLLKKRSAKYDAETGRMTTEKHTVGALYKSVTTYTGNGQKYTDKKLFGLRFRKQHLGPLSSKETTAEEMRTQNIVRHQKAWKDVIVTHQIPVNGTTKRLQGAAAASATSPITLGAGNEVDQSSVNQSQTPKKASKSATKGMTETEKEIFKKFAPINADVIARDGEAQPNKPDAALKRGLTRPSRSANSIADF